MTFNRVSIFGAGSMGTACAILLAKSGHHVTLWCRRAEAAEAIDAARENAALLPGYAIPKACDVSADIEVAADSDLYIFAVPSKHLRELLTNIAPSLRSNTPAVSVIKGIEQQTLARPSQIIADVLGDRPIASLSGPSHAEEIAREMPTSVVVASNDENLVLGLQDLFCTDRFRVYHDNDLVGVELAGALKNVVGIAAGICDGVGFGDNAKAALLTRAIAEMTRFGATVGADPATFAGLAGVGDLITTCVSPHGRNRSVGERLGKGETLAQIVDGNHMVAEGVTTAQSIAKMAADLGIDMPIVNAVCSVLFGEKSPVDATNDLMTRPPRAEKAD